MTRSSGGSDDTGRAERGERDGWQEPGGSQEPDRWDEEAQWAAAEWPVIDTEVEAIVNRASMVIRYIDRSSVDTLDDLGLAQGDLKVLLRLTRGRKSPGEIARGLLVSTGTMTNRLDKLERAGLVVRHPDPADRRGVLVELTAPGRTALDHYIGVQAKRERQLLNGLSADEKRQLARLLRKLLASVTSEAGFVKR